MRSLNRNRRAFLKAASVTLAGGLLASRASQAAAAFLASAETKILTGEPLDATEIHHLEFIREEEKLARDVYIVMAEKWGNPIFSLIIESEQRHMDAMLKLLNYFDIEDPVPDDGVGSFTNSYIGGLFTTLTERGIASEDEALAVGAFIEEYDILDIWKAVGETDVDHINEVYTNLYEGSYNHLRGYVYNWEKNTGKIYTPQLMDPEDYKDCIGFDTQAKQKQNG
ncbi:DUF2202 domain-containing protein [Desulfoprunum benzoelyticum]|uniref:DUF2202 domain-containing protein n=1 Tax=Desulfoprunum benzoelyticum TaxID=1506996 RepID=A0A840ULX0_9BACT|nr:DUF2202 domain-containing protein [Desulfoprunum benzoelyticum]MBB5347297.1 hypothetical protein [Desulfoprunum benzoelyticum]MBM9531451.1 DUF2202 domain-containing protein [Desulfoprunum benzoelyticum]